MLKRISYIQGALLGLLSFVKLAHPITIVGNDLVSNEEGFLAKKPLSYAFVKRDENRILFSSRMLGIPLFGTSSNNSLESQNSAELVIRTLANQFDGLVANTPKEFLAYFNSGNRTNTWRPLVLPSNIDNCIVGAISEKAESINIALSWGPNKGILAFGNYPEKLKPELLRMIQSIQLNPGACAWKSN